MLSATHFKHVLWLLVAVTLALQWVALHISKTASGPQWEAVSSGLGIFWRSLPSFMGGGAGTKRPAASSRDCASSFDCGAARDLIRATGPTRHEHGRFAFLKGQQWTLLIGMLPVVYAVSARGLGAMEVSVRCRDSCQSIVLSDGGDRYIRTVCDTVAGAGSGLQVLLFDFLRRFSRGLVAGKKDTRDGVFGLFSRGAATEALEKR